MSERVIHLESPVSNAQRIWRRSVMATAIAAGSFTLAVAAIMLVSWMREQQNHPLTLTTLTNMRERLNRNPEDDAIRERIRVADLEIRRVFFARRAFINRGAYLLLAGGIVVALAVKLGYRLGAQPYMPDPANSPTAGMARAAGRARTAVGVAALVTAGTFLAFASMPRYRLPSFPAEPPQVLPPPPLPQVNVTPEMIARNWAGFRGPGGSAIAAPGEYPTSWHGASGQGILWKSAVPLPGNTSPVVWDERVFLSGASPDKREIYCFDAASGALRWQQAVPFSPGVARPELSEEAGYSNCTLAADGNRVYGIFPNGDLVAFDFAGRRLWQRNLGLPENTYGHASSLLTYKNRVLVQYDQGHDEKDSKSALLAFEGATGEPIWKAARAVQSSWATPILAQTPAGTQIIAAGCPLVIAHDPETGNEIWRAKVFNSVEVAPSPVYQNGMVFVCVDRADLMGIRVDGKGDVTKTHIPWKFPDDLPDTTSPLVAGEFVYMVSTGGVVSCVEVQSGKRIYTQELKGQFNASPSLAGGRIYMPNTDGVTYVFEPGRAYKEIGQPALGEAVRASPAFVGGKIYIRGKDNLYCVGVKR